MDLYERAIVTARANGFVHNEAIANELAARFYAARGFPMIANAYLREARSCYLRWGADGKVRHLESLHPFLREPESARAAAATIAASIEHLDLATVVKVSQAVSGEMVLEKLIDALMRLAIEHAGAERGLLLLSRGNDLRQEAEAVTGGDGIIVRRQDGSVAVLPDSIVHYVRRSREIVLLDDASAHPTYASDPYVRERNARSILCLPLVNEAKVTGVLYLENSLAPHVFTPDRVTVLKVLASQAAISLENSRLYRDLADFAHLNRVSMMGELAASLFHEITQPIASARNNARAAQNFLDMQPPDFGEVREALVCLVGDADRAGEIVDRIRDHIKKAPPRKDRFDLNAAINDVIMLAQSAIAKNGVAVRTRLMEGLRPVHGDRVQLQQVVLNLILNAVEALGSVEAGARELSISTEQNQTGGVLVAVRDSGPGVDPDHLGRVFEAFYTTKSSGVGVGLAICRSIVNGHGGRLWAEANEPCGAVFQFTLPAAEKELTNSSRAAHYAGEPHEGTVSDVSHQSASEGNK